MSKLDLLTAELSFHGDDVIKTIEDNSLLYDSVWSYAKRLQNSKIRVYTNPRIDPDGPAEWSMTITSSFGRKTFNLFQRTPTGSVTFQPD